MLKFCLPAVALFLLVTAAAPTAGAEPPNLLTNPGFETDGTTGWSFVGGDLTIDAVSNTGDWGALLTSDGQDTVAKMRQDVPVEPLAKYELTGWALLYDPNLDYVKLQILWFDADRNYLGESDSAPLVNGVVEPGTYTRATTTQPETDPDAEPVTAPPAAAFAAIVGIAYGVTGNVFSAYFDDFSFKQIAPPPPTPVPTEPPTSAPTPPPTPAPTNAPTSTQTPSPSPTRTPTPTPKPTPSPTPRPPITPPPEPAVFNALTNGGFEQPGQDGPYGWRKIGGTVAQDTAHRRSGSNSLSLQSASTSTKWAYQTVTVQGGAYYLAAAFAMQNNSRPGDLFLRISWYSTNDGNGEAIANDDSTATLSANSTAFQPLSTNPVQAPASARSVRIRLMFRPANASPASAYFDDISFYQTTAPTDAPATPTPPPGASATPAPTVGPGHTPTPRPTSTATAPGATEPPASPGTPDEPDAFPSLTNGSFEDAREDGTPYGWHKTGGSFAVSPDNRTDGDLALDITSDTASTKWVYEVVQVTPGAYYRASAWALNTAPGDELLLRISWYTTANGDGSSLSDSDAASTVTGASTGFRLLETDAVRAPSGAHSARVRLLLRPASASPTHAFFDDVRLSPTSPPPGAPVAAGSSGGEPASDHNQTPGGDSSHDGAVLGAGAAPGGLTDGGANLGEGTSVQPSSGGSSDWLIALAILVPVLGIAVALGVPYLRRKRAAPAEPPAA